MFHNLQVEIPNNELHYLGMTIYMEPDSNEAFTLVYTAVEL